MTVEQRSAANAYDLSYDYGPTGNRLVTTDSGALTTYTYNTADELTLVQPPSGQPTTMSWDANGNLSLENAGGLLTTYIRTFRSDGTVRTFCSKASQLDGAGARSETEFVYEKGDRP